MPRKCTKSRTRNRQETKETSQVEQSPLSRKSKLRKYGHLVNVNTTPVRHPTYDDMLLLSQSEPCDVQWQADSPITLTQADLLSKGTRDMAELVRKFTNDEPDIPQPTGTPPFLAQWRNRLDSESNEPKTPFIHRKKRRRPTGIKASIDAKELFLKLASVFQRNETVDDPTKDISQEVTQQAEYCSPEKHSPVRRTDRSDFPEMSFDLFESTLKSSSDEDIGLHGSLNPTSACNSTRKMLGVTSKLNQSVDDLWTDEELFDDDSFIIKATQLETKFIRKNISKKDVGPRTPENAKPHTKQFKYTCESSEIKCHPVTLQSSIGSSKQNVSSTSITYSFKKPISTTSNMNLIKKLPVAVSYYSRNNAASRIERLSATSLASQVVGQNSQYIRNNNNNVNRSQLQTMNSFASASCQKMAPHNNLQQGAALLPKPCSGKESFQARGTAAHCFKAIRPVAQKCFQTAIDNHTSVSNVIDKGHVTKKPVSQLVKFKPIVNTQSKTVPVPNAKVNIIKNCTKESGFSGNVKPLVSTAISKTEIPLESSVRINEVPIAVSSPGLHLNDTSITDDLLVTLAEPDEILESQAFPDLDHDNWSEEELEDGLLLNVVEIIGNPTSRDCQNKPKQEKLKADSVHCAKSHHKELGLTVQTRKTVLPVTTSSSGNSSRTNTHSKNVLSLNTTNNSKMVDSTSTTLSVTSSGTSQLLKHGNYKSKDHQTETALNDTFPSDDEIINEDQMLEMLELAESQVSASQQSNKSEPVMVTETLCPQPPLAYSSKSCDGFDIKCLAKPLTVPTASKDVAHDVIQYSHNRANFPMSKANLGQPLQNGSNILPNGFLTKSVRKPHETKTAESAYVDLNEPSFDSAPWLTDKSYPKCSADEILKKKELAMKRRQQNKLRLIKKK